MIRRGRGLLQLPGPTNIPERVLRAMHRPAVDFGTAEFARLLDGCLADLATIAGTRGRVFVYAALGHGAWEAALVNLVGPNEAVLVPDTGRFARGWAEMAGALGIEVREVPTDPRRPLDPGRLEEVLRADRGHAIRAVLLCHVETSTGVRHDPRAVRAALDRAGHPALLVVDAIASFAAESLAMDAWGIDCLLAASQKGLMLPPGLAFVFAGPRALETARRRPRPRKYWDWRGRDGVESYEKFYGTPPTQMIFGLREALDMLREEGMDAVFARHARLARAVRAAVARWAEAGALFFHCLEPEARADTVTAVGFADGVEPERIRTRAREGFGVAFGGGIGPFRGRLLRIGHMGDLDEAMVLGALGVLELVLRLEGVPHAPGGVEAAIAALAAR
ncbi:MAG: aminotransferase class V-fold PLP-dependent enzyme [Geminicoccaceae bacterium]|nr:aminotransferase class V-fold PLP-dependent enzyme [Geminicoccaceae bacterium]MDW8342438.1 aminotransferase class V-fold PLP-dependent enzyme [Geminicoccaceae bacterium]